MFLLLCMLKDITRQSQNSSFCCWLSSFTGCVVLFEVCVHTSNSYCTRSMHIPQYLFLFRMAQKTNVLPALFQLRLVPLQGNIWTSRDFQMSNPTLLGPWKKEVQWVVCPAGIDFLLVFPFLQGLHWSCGRHPLNSQNILPYDWWKILLICKETVLVHY